jgi:hypothetical protein
VAYDKGETGRGGLQDHQSERLPVGGEEENIRPAVGCTNIIDEPGEADVLWTMLEEALEARTVEEKSIDPRPNPDERDAREKVSNGEKILDTLTGDHLSRAENRGAIEAVLTPERIPLLLIITEVIDIDPA